MIVCGLTQEEEVDEESAGDHAEAAEDEHHEEVSRAASEVEVIKLFYTHCNQCSGIIMEQHT